jgi:hypothetical protein
MNGKEKPHEDVANLVKGWEAERQAKDHELKASLESSIDSDNRETEDDNTVVVGADESSGVDVAAESAEDTPPPSKSTRSKTKSKSKK